MDSGSSSNRRRSGTSARKRIDVEDLAAVKAAAWAWYQRGVGNEGKSTTEFDLARPNHEPRPTRFKLESLRSSFEWSSSSSSPSHSSLLSTSGSPKSVLLDHYEIATITREISCLLEVPKEKAGVNKRQDHRTTPAPRVLAESRKKSSPVGGFKLEIPWYRQATGACRSGSDVAEGVIVVDRRRPGHRSRKMR